MSSPRLASLPTAIGALLALAACSTTVDQRGNLPPSDLIGQIHPGKTTKDQVVKILGSPSSVSVFGDKDWYYISARTKQYAFFTPEVLAQEVYIVDFNDDGVVRVVEHKTLRDRQQIVPVARTTPAPGRELSFFEQLIGNLGKFNSGGGGSAAATGATRQPGPSPYDNSQRD
jgi:outer membrane protein assembly factor BamE (lipoprotein component of BamABCDE complex)